MSPLTAHQDALRIPSHLLTQWQSLLQAQGDDLKGILVDLQAKADDLKEAIQQRTSTKNAMKVLSYSLFAADFGQNRLERPTFQSTFVLREGLSFVPTPAAEPLSLPHRQPSCSWQEVSTL